MFFYFINNLIYLWAMSTFYTNHIKKFLAINILEVILIITLRVNFIILPSRIEPQLY